MDIEGVVRKAIEAINQHNLDGLMSLYAKDVLHLHPYSQPTIGIEALRKENSEFFDAFPDLRFEVSNLLSKGDWASAEDDLRIRVRTFLQDLSGVLEGHSVAQSIVRSDLNALTVSQAITVVFTGTVGDSKPGTVTWINTVVSDLSDPENFTFKGRIVVIEGSGHAGLEGICGGGTTLGQGPAGGPFSAESDFAFAFGDACQDFNPFDQDDN